MVQNGRADGTIVKANYFLDKLAPAIGNRPIHEIEPFEVLAPLKRLETVSETEEMPLVRRPRVSLRCRYHPLQIRSDRMLKGALVRRATHYAAISSPPS